jgi:ubiquinone/menaquinone biosynthesis C-methylase UbiE
MDLALAYRHRFEATGLEKRNRVWSVLCSAYFNRLIGPGQDVLDLACGYGEFINNVEARSKFAIDLNPDAERFLARDVRFIHSVATAVDLPGASVDVVFTSNFLEHLADKTECDAVLAEVFRLLRPGGRFIIMGPNIKYCSRNYWDFYDHHLPLSHLSLEEGLAAAGYELVSTIPRFLPFTMKGRTPSSDLLVRAYLAMPAAWPFMGKQFLVTARKPIGH